MIAQSPFSDLISIVKERAPFFATADEVAQALALAERRAGFRVREVSAADAATRIRVPVLLLHGGQDRETSPAHSRRIQESLGGPRRLEILEQAGHNDVLSQERAWRAIEDWLSALGGKTGARPTTHSTAVATGGAVSRRRTG